MSIRQSLGKLFRGVSMLLWAWLLTLPARADRVEVRNLDVIFTGLPRACAGAIVDDVHTFTLQVQVRDRGAQLPGEPPRSVAGLQLSFSIDKKNIDYTGCKPPKFIDDQNQVVETLIKTVDAEGKTNIRVLSSDLVSTSPGTQPVLIVKWKTDSGSKLSVHTLWKTVVTDQEEEVQGMPCDFATAQSIRRHGIKDLNQGYKNQDGEVIDLGWNFDDLLMQEENDITDATVYMKFRKDPDDVMHPIDEKYFLINGAYKPSLDTGDGNGGPPDGWVDDDEYDVGQIRGLAPQPLLDDDANWLPVSNHHLYIRIAAIEDIDFGPVAPSDFAQYVVFDNNGGSAISTTTDTEGKATVRLRAGSWIYWCRSIKLEAVNLTQKSWTGINASTGW